MLGALICTKFIVTLSDQRLMPHCTLDHFGDEYQQTSLQQLTMAHSVAQNGSDIFLFSSLSFLLLSLSFFSSILPSFFSFFPFISILPLPLTSPIFFHTSLPVSAALFVSLLPCSFIPCLPFFSLFPSVEDVQLHTPCCRFCRGLAMLRCLAYTAASYTKYSY